MSAAEKVEIKLNQNLWGLLLSLSTLGISEYFCLCTLYWFGLIISILASVSFIATIIPYTLHYCKKKIKDINSL